MIRLVGFRAVFRYRTSRRRACGDYVGFDVVEGIFVAPRWADPVGVEEVWHEG